MKVYLNMREDIVLCSQFPTALMITSHFHPALQNSNHMIHYVDMTVPHKQDQEHGPRHSHTTHCIQMWVIHLIVEIKNFLSSVLTHGHYIHILTVHLYFSGIMTIPLTGTAFLPPHLITTISPDLKHLMDYKINHCEESHC